MPKRYRRTKADDRLAAILLVTICIEAAVLMWVTGVLSPR